MDNLGLSGCWPDAAGHSHPGNQSGSFLKDRTFTRDLPHSHFSVGGWGARIPERWKLQSTQTLPRESQGLWGEPKDGFRPKRKQEKCPSAGEQARAPPGRGSAPGGEKGEALTQENVTEGRALS